MPRSRGVSAATAALVAVLFSPVALLAQDAVIQGTVVSGTQSPVPGAFVAIDGMAASAVTNDNGRYRLIVPAARVEGQQITFLVSSIGYRETSAQITLRAGTIEQNFTMSEQAISLDEVLVTGTAGNQERRAQPAVVSAVNAAQITEVAPVQSVANILQARTPGVVIRNESGTDGTASQIRIRGVSSIELSNDPLIFIDGIQMNGDNDNVFNVGGQERSFLNDIKIEEIESIEVVKGPAAATLYGSDANAGVINIITKRGRAQSGFVQSITLEYGEADPNFTPPTNYGICNQEAIDDPDVFPACQGQPVGTALSDNPLVRESSFGDGRRRNLVWSLRGGGEQYAAFFSLGADDSRGTLGNNRYGHISGRANFDYFVSDDLRMEFGLGLNRTNTQLPRNDNDIYGYLGGGLLGDPRTVGAAKDGWYAPNRQTLAISAYENVNRTMRIQPRVSIQYTPISWFSNRLTFGGDLIRTRAFSFWAKNDDGWWDDAPRNTGRIGEASRSEDRLTFDYLGNITSNLTNDLRADLSFGSQVITEHTYETEAEGTGLVTNDVRSVDAAAELTGGGQESDEERQVGFFAQAQFGWRDRLFLQFGGRVDQQSTFGADSDPFYSPKVGLSYVISDESFFRDLIGENIVTTLRLRGAYGVTGRAPSSGARSTFEPSSYQINPTDVAVGVVPEDTGNPELRAEKGKELELGFEAGLFEDRLGLELTYFHKRTDDAILELPIPGSLGASSPLVNMGSILNRGFEIAANARVLTFENVSLELFGTLNTLHNELLDLGDAPETATMKEGFPLEGQWDYTIHEVDLENDRVIVSDTLEFRGNGLELPGYEGTFSGTLTLFRNLSLYAQADFRGDVMVFNSTDEFRDRDFGIGGLAVLGCEFIEVDANGECSDAARIKYMRKFGPWVTDEGRELSRNTVDGDYTEEGSFTRLREVSVSYRVPSAFVERYLRAQSASLTLAMRNLRTWTSFTGLDPETDQFLTVPQDQRWTVRFNFTF